MRWWRLAMAGAILAWVLGAAYSQARRRGRGLGAAVLLVGGAAAAFVVAAFVPRPPLTERLSQVLVVGSVGLLAAAMALVLWRGFRG